MPLFSIFLAYLLLSLYFCTKQARSTKAAACTSDYLPTVLATLGIESAAKIQPMDGINLLPLPAGSGGGPAVPWAASDSGAIGCTQTAPGDDIVVIFG